MPVWKLLEAESGSSRISEEMSGILRNLQEEVGRLHPATGGGCYLNLPAGRLSWGAEPGPRGVAGAVALPGQGGQAGGAGELVEACPALRNR